MIDVTRSECTRTNILSDAIPAWKILYLFQVWVSGIGKAHIFQPAIQFTLYCDKFSKASSIVVAESHVIILVTSIKPSLLLL